MSQQTSNSTRRSSRRSRPLHDLFESVACDLTGYKMNGTAYRRGSTLAGDACSYQFRPQDHLDEPGQNGQDSAPSFLADLVSSRLVELLPQADIDLLFLLYVADWSQADVAREHGCHRSTVMRQERRILTVVRADPVLGYL